MNKLVDYFVNKPKQLNRSAGKFVRGERGGEIFKGTTIDEVNEAKREAREILDTEWVSKTYNQDEEANKKKIKDVFQDILVKGETFLKITEEETNHQTGDKKTTIESDKPLSPKEIEELVGVDNISTFVDRSWLKSHKNGTWTYSILTICKIKDFYSSEELNERLRDIFKEKYDRIGFDLNNIEKPHSDKALFVYIADDHAGLVLKDSLYQKEYSGKTYAQRLLCLAQEIIDLNQHFEEINIVRLGDEMDGYNGKTTRYDHNLGSLSNKEQFDIYTIANRIFYNEILNSKIANNYNIINLCNSNHTGLGFSYIANRALEFWIEVSFKNVNIIHQTKFIDTYMFGNHVIALTHGKDEKHMKAPMPLNLDYKTDLWLMEYFKQFYLDGKFVSTIKGDIHKFNMNQGKSGRYVNVPSISSGSSWIEHNYGDSESGCLLEIYTSDSKNVQTIPIWF